MTIGSLILEQMYEDKVMAEGSLLVSGPEEGHVDPLNLTNAVISTGGH